MSVKEDCQTKSEIKKIIKSNKIVILKFGAKWCRPCKLIAPQYKELANNVSSNIKKRNIPENIIQFLSIDVDDLCKETGQKWGDLFECSAVPMFVIFYQNKTEKTFMGADLEEVSEFINNLIHIALNTASIA
jgi:thiol-disulfide isomerase/thioredoxin